MNRTTGGRHLRVRRLLLVAIAVLGALVAACTGASPHLPTAGPGASGGPSAAGVAGGSPAASTGAGQVQATGEPASSDPTVAWPAFAACLRAHGLNVADPQLDSAGNPDFGQLNLQALITPDIDRDCSPLVARITAAKAAAKQYDFASLVLHAACLRAHGLPNYPDPDPNAQVQTLAPGYSKADPTVNAALIACKPLLVQVGPSPSASR
jgi:hypothetical protein